MIIRNILVYDCVFLHSCRYSNNQTDVCFTGDFLANILQAMNPQGIHPLHDHSGHGICCWCCCRWRLGSGGGNFGCSLGSDLWPLKLDGEQESCVMNRAARLTFLGRVGLLLQERC
jgi:hypothetical protein